MAATPGAAALVSVSTSSGGTYDEIVGIKDANIKTAIDALETTAFSDTSGSGSDRTYIAGLRGRTLDMSGRFERTDTGYAKIKTVVDGTYANLFFKFLPDGTNGYRVEGIVTDHEVKGVVDGLIEVSMSITVTGAVTVV